MENGYNYNNEFNTSNFNPPKKKNNKAVIGIAVVIIVVAAIAFGLLWKTDFFKSTDPEPNKTETNINEGTNGGSSDNNVENGESTGSNNNEGNASNGSNNTTNPGNSGSNGSSGTNGTTQVPVKSKLTCKKEYVIEELNITDTLVAEFDTNTAYLKTWNIESIIDYNDALHFYEGLEQEEIIEEIKRLKEAQLGDLSAFTIETENEGTIINFTFSTDASKLKGTGYYTDAFTKDGEFYFPNYEEIYKSGEYTCES